MTETDTKQAVRYFAGDDSGGPITPLEATGLEAAIAEARESARDTAADAAATQQGTALQDWVVYSDGNAGSKGGVREDLLVRESSGLEQADPDAPQCAGGAGSGGHAWRNPDPQWAGYGNSQGGGVTVVRKCELCGATRTVSTLQDDGQGGTYESVQYAT